MNRISFRQEEQSQIINRLKTLQHVHDNMLKQMFSELAVRFKNREISDRFWDVLPSDVRSKYKESISGVRSKIRDIIMQYPQYYEGYKKQNKPYFQKLDKKNRDTVLKSMEEEPFPHEMAEV